MADSGRVSIHNSCASCHAYPAAGGSSPASNPLFSVYHLNGATNTMPFFITSTGPILEARFINQPGTTTPDGNVHQIFTVVGRSDAAGCNIAQPDFVTAAAQGNLVLRQVPPTYGDGLIEIVRNIDIVNNMNSNLSTKAALGITGHPNYSGNDGSIQRFGWKAQVRSTLLMAAQQMNVEMGVTNETFPNEIDQTPGCVFNGVPETVTNFTPGILTEMFPGDAERTEYFIQWMAPPTPGPLNLPPRTGRRSSPTQVASIAIPRRSRRLRPRARRWATSPSSCIPIFWCTTWGRAWRMAFRKGSAGPDEFRTAPLWGIGQRLFFMHDGRTNNIVTAIEDHFSLGNSTYPASEANQSVTNFNNLSSKNQQDLVNFLRSL